MHQTKEIAHILQVTPTTVRRYCKDFENHLSEGTKRKRRVFTDEDATTLQRAQRLMGEGYTKKEVEKLLYVQETAPDIPPERALAVFPEIANIIHQTETHLEQAETRLDILEEEVEKLRHYTSQNWFRRMFTKPPE